ncbi:MAG: hypothetical protein AAB336_09745, partial [Acidobacteriota bacterium]
MANVKSYSVFLVIFLLCFSFTNGQTITEAVPEKIDKSRKYLIYLHGGIVQDLGADAVSEDFGKYEYYKILETFKERGFNIISEVRLKGTEITPYSEKLSEQIRLLQKRGVKDKNIVVVGASLGAYMTIEAADKLKLKKVKYVLIGLCSEYAVKRYEKYKGNLLGNFLSIYETSDQKGTCQTIFESLHR